jgi:hypothetical protein
MSPLTDATQCSADPDACVPADETRPAPKEPETAPVSPHGNLDVVEPYEGHGDNAWVQGCRHWESQDEEAGASLLEAADADGRRADTIQTQSGEAASAQWSAGHYFDAARTQLSGNAQANMERLKQAAHVAGAAVLAADQGMAQLARGDEGAVRKAAIGAAAGAAVVAAVPTGGASLTLLTPVTAGGAALTAYEVVHNAGGIPRARDVDELGTAATKTALAAAGPYLAKGLGEFLGPLLKEAGWTEAAEEAISRVAPKELGEFVSNGILSPEAAQKVLAELEAHGTEALQEVLAHGLEQMAMHPLNEALDAEAEPTRKP